jgi:hypothetical protein
MPDDTPGKIVISPPNDIDIIGTTTPYVIEIGTCRAFIDLAPALAVIMPDLASIPSNGIDIIGAAAPYCLKAVSPQVKNLTPTLAIIVPDDARRTNGINIIRTAAPDVI